ncbi:sucrose-6-phosphate hydrolase [Neobacillus bataviensis LMG 21833]|uniref:Sucrose-6-phosphate hydrolase n=1 Tax=Neobacillus bataviensis LMG 21833 TaxID=1117379 RepID=K6DNJ4_9BACI|nr:glycoside hydrolase family 32 protein [Neobacillus bataviensis]EKN69743.1 sucrose-6-phosphate hydrolase [Neobacillus bataviensis LMG 21833]
MVLNNFKTEWGEASMKCHAAEKATVYTRNNKAKVNSQYRMNYHLMPEIGWMNDPNGFIFYQGHYHLFYQYHPYDSVWGPMHWGHAITKDLISWEHLPVAIAPEDSFDSMGCFSGTAIEKDEDLNILYTGCYKNSDGEVVQNQNVAFSKDGVSFTKYPFNPVIPSEKVPEFASSIDFRDPKIFKKNDEYYCIVASCTQDRTPLLLLYKSVDLIEWNFFSELLKGMDGQGRMWECPDYVHIDGTDVLIFSPIELLSDVQDFQNLSSCVYVTGKIDWEKGIFLLEDMNEIDHGLDFYAAQTTISEDGNPVLVAWMQMWDRNIPTHTEGHKWAGAMTIPRQLQLKNKQLYQVPIPLIDNYFERDTFLQEHTIENNELFSITDCCRIKVIMKKNDNITLKFSSTEEEYMLIDYTKQENEVTFSRSQMGHKIIGKENPPLNSRRVKVSSETDNVQLDILLDVSSIELFIDGGKDTMSSRIYPFEKINKLMISGGNVEIVSLEILNYIGKSGK